MSKKIEMVYLNGVLVPKEEARISVYDRGFMYGDGIFETVRIYQGIPFRLNQHLERLQQGAAVLGISLPSIDMAVAASMTIKANGVDNGVLRISVSRGETATGENPTVVITARDTLPYTKEQYENGFKGIISKIHKDQYSPICKIKSSNFLLLLLAREEAVRAGVDEAILLNLKGFVAEGSVSNIFLVKDGVLTTPSASSGILPGITRMAVMETAEGIGFKAEDREVLPGEIYLADEVFLTNSLMEVMPLVEVDGRRIGDGRPGKITGAIQDGYRRVVGGSVVSQACIS